MRTDFLRKCPSLVRVAATMALCAALSACAGGNSDLQKWVAEVKARPAPPLEPLPVMQQFETFEYKQTLEQFPLDSLNMVGTLGRGAGSVALVMAPDKVTYRVRPGVYLGQSDGRVTAVYEDRIELIELVPDGAGGWLERPATIALEDN